MKKSLSILALVLAFGAASTQADSVYKWTDKDGVTHYGDRQPQGQTSESVDVVTGTSRSSVEGGKNGRPSAQERLQAMDSGQQNADEQTNTSRAEEARLKQRRKNCEIARKNLKALNTYGRIKIEENGEQRYLTPEEIETKKTEFQKIAEDACDEPSGGSDP